MSGGCRSVPDRDKGCACRAERGWVGDVGDYSQLSEADVRGTEYVGARELDGGHPSGAGSVPFQSAQRHTDGTLFQGDYGKRLEKILSRYPERQAALLPVLAMAHEIRGHLPQEALLEVAGALGLSPAYVRGVASFYTMYNSRPVGRYLIQVCTNVSCNICGGDDVLQAFLEHTGTEPGEISPDGLFTVLEAECLGACGFPTVVQINERYFEDVAPGDVPAILEKLAEEPFPVDEGHGRPKDDPDGSGGDRVAGGGL